jgi:hypothetical protein
MALTKVTGKGITCSAVTEDKLGTSAVTTNKIGPDAVTSAKINNGAVTADDLASTLDLSSKTLTLPNSLTEDLKRPVQDNIALLGFKMAVNDGLTVFNLVDGVVDEFNDESGTDEAEGSNDYYCGTTDFYTNNFCGPNPISAGFSMTSITEPQTSTTGTNPGFGIATSGIFTVPCGVTSIDIKVWGAGGGAGVAGGASGGGGGGFTSGTLAVTSGQNLYISAGEGGTSAGPGGVGSNKRAAFFGGGVGSYGSPAMPGQGGGLAGVFNFKPECVPAPFSFAGEPGESQISVPTYSPQIYIASGAGGGASSAYPVPYATNGGGGGGLTGNAGGTTSEQTSNSSPTHGGGGGSQSAGGSKFSPLCGPASGATSGDFLTGGSIAVANCQPATPKDIAIGGTGGAGFYGGGAGTKSAPAGPGDPQGSGGGGSSYYGHPQITSGVTEDGGESNSNFAGGGLTDPAYVAGTNEGGGEDGYVLITSPQTFSSIAQPGGGSTTIISGTFTSTSVPTSSRIVVFEENIDTPTLNTDIIASVSRDGTNFTNATLADSGYVTGSSGQRILTGQADISGQPSGQSMRWKLALANNTVKIHGVALQWS